MSANEIDPMQPPSQDLNRRAFVGITAATAALGASASALAQSTAPLGQSHPPLVSPDDPAIVVEHVVLKSKSDAAAVPAYAAWPAHATSNVLSVVVVMHVWGVDESIRDAVRRLAKAGFAAIAPDLYARFDAPSGDGSTDSDTFRTYAQRLERKQYDGDLRAGANWLAAKFPATKSAILGFCMGGHLALLAAIDDGDAFAVVCPFYGSVEGVDPAAIRMPVCGSYGARDTSIPADSVRAFAAALRVPNDIRIYDEAGHAFFDDQRPRYVASAAADAWKRTLAFLEKHLGTPSG